MIPKKGLVPYMCSSSSSEEDEADDDVDSGSFSVDQTQLNFHNDDSDSNSQLSQVSSEPFKDSTNNDSNSSLSQISSEPFLEQNINSPSSVSSSSLLDAEDTNFDKINGSEAPTVRVNRIDTEIREQESPENNFVSNYIVIDYSHGFGPPIGLPPLSVVPEPLRPAKDTFSWEFEYRLKPIYFPLDYRNNTSKFAKFEEAVSPEQESNDNGNDSETESEQKLLPLGFPDYSWRQPIFTPPPDTKTENQNQNQNNGTGEPATAQLTTFPDSSVASKELNHHRVIPIPSYPVKLCSDPRLAARKIERSHLDMIRKKAREHFSKK